MQLSGRPLLDNAHDHALFVGRSAVLARLDRSLRSGLNCLVIGEPGSGRTSLVRELMFRSHQAQDGTRFCYVRANDEQSAAGLLLAILDTLGGTAPRSPSGSAAPADLLTDLSGQVAAARDVAGSGPIVVVVEDVPATVGAAVFGALRDELWQVDVRWLVTVSSAQAVGVRRPPADVFFETQIELDPLTPDEATELLRRRFDRFDPDRFDPDRFDPERFDPERLDPDRLDPDRLDSGHHDSGHHDAGHDAAVEVAAASGARTPRRLLEIARGLSGPGTVGATGLTVGQGLAARDAVLAQLSRPARILAGELEAVGWASASDERLLDRMGWTRPRIVQVISELQARGLVEMREESTGRGRPRKVYRLTPAEKFTDRLDSDTPASDTPASDTPTSDIPAATRAGQRKGVTP